jgi:hypothetical protein
MRFLNDLCPPALLYAAFLAIGLGFDVADLRVVTVLSKIIFGGATVYVLDLLCRVDLGVVSWFIVAVPFIVTALATSIAMGMNLDAQVTQLLSGKTNLPEKKTA